MTAAEFILQAKTDYHAQNVGNGLTLGQYMMKALKSANPIVFEIIQYSFTDPSELYFRGEFNFDRRVKEVW